MGQIRGTKAKISACNIRSLSSFGIPYAGMHILVSTDNSAMEDGNGNFDAYVVGNGRDAATALELKKCENIEELLCQVTYNYLDNISTLTNNGGAGLTLLDGFEVVAGHTYNVYAKSETSVGSPSQLQLGLGSNGNMNISAAQLLEGVTYQKNATTSASSRIYIAMSGGTSVKVYVKIEDVTEPSSFATKGYIPINEGLIKFFKDNIITQSPQNGGNSVVPSAESLKFVFDSYTQKLKNATVTYIAGPCTNTIGSVDASPETGGGCCSEPIYYNGIINISYPSASNIVVRFVCYDETGKVLYQQVVTNGTSYNIKELAPTTAYIRLRHFINGSNVDTSLTNGIVAQVYKNVLTITQDDLPETSAFYDGTTLRNNNGQSASLENLTVDKCIPTFHYGSINLSTGEVVDGDGGCYSDPIQILSPITIKWTDTRNVVVRYNIYDSSMQFLGYAQATNGNTYDFVSIYPNAAYLRLRHFVYGGNQDTSTDNGIYLEGRFNGLNADNLFHSDGTKVKLYSEDIIKGNIYGNILRQLAFYTAQGAWSGVKHNPLNLLHFSDIHGDGVNLSRITQFKKKYSDFITDVIHTGDNINSSWAIATAFDFWTNTEDSEYFLNTIGNHDSYNGTNWYAKSAAENYATFIAPFVNNWGVVSTADVCYYYKDYTAKGVRLIVLDVMHWDSTQETWLTNALNGAKTNSLHVIVAGHCPPGVASNGNSDCAFDCFMANHSAWENEGYGKMNAAVPAAVNSFIEDGGIFICYLCGHTHTDLFRHIDAYQNQYYIAVANASNNDNVGANAASYVARKTGERSQDLFNIVTVDVTNKLLTVTRIGNDMDRIGRHQGGFVWNYETKTIIHQY